MIDIKLIRENPELVRENIKKKFQDYKLEMLDNAIDIDKKYREVQLSIDNLRMERNNFSNEIGNLMKQGKKDDAINLKLKVNEINEKTTSLEEEAENLKTSLQDIMMKIPNIIHESVPIGKDDSQNIEIQKYGEPVVLDYEIPYHTDIMESLSGIDLDAARRVAGNGFYYLVRRHCKTSF